MLNSEAGANPIEIFQKWFEEYQATSPKEPTAVTLATASPEGVPSARVVLIKDFSPAGFTFYTNYESDKSLELRQNPRAQLLFFWESLVRQVRITGRVEKVPTEVSDAYFAIRPYGSQIGAWASPQSQAIPDRKYLEARVRELEEKFPEGSVPRPPHWGGWCLIPQKYEFWTGRENRLHDRVVYELGLEGWTVSRLAP